jgi:4-hydroxybenzoate polyprenyltransferase
LRSAIVLGSVLLTTGVVAAGAAGIQSLLVAGLLVQLILAYDGLLKSTPRGPLAMGGCRFLNVMLGASAAGTPLAMATASGVWNLPQLHVAAGLGIYIAGVTWFARRETEQSRRGPLIGATGVINLGLALLVAFLMNWPDAAVEPRRMRAMLVLALIAVTINRRLVSAMADPGPARVQLAIKTMLLSVVMIDSTLVYFVQPQMVYSLYVVALLIPALGLARFLAVT